MRIAVFSEVCLPFVNGIATQVSLLQQSLSSLGHQVLVVASDLHAQEFYTNGNVLYCPARPAKNPFDMEIIPKKEDELWELLTEFEPDLLHIHTATGLGQFAVRYSERLDLPVVTTVYDGCAGLLSYYGPSLLKGITQARCKSHIRRVLENSD